MEKCYLTKSVFISLWTLIFCLTVNAADEHTKLRDEVRALAEQIKTIKTSHLHDVTVLKKEIEELKQKESVSTTPISNNDMITLKWARTSMQELRTEIREMGRNINNSVLLHQLHVIRNQLKQALGETTDLVRVYRSQEARVDKFENQLIRLKYDGQQIRNMMSEIRDQFVKLNKEVNDQSANQEWNSIRHNDEDKKPQSDMSHKHRHNKMVHSQLSRLARTQNHISMYQKSLQSQMLDVQKRIDKLEEPNWNLLSAKLDFADLEIKVMRDKFQNMTQKVSDFDKVHSSVLELREDIESIEAKADKIMPEFRNEISKLDINYAQLNAQVSYLKEGQENLRQTVKAIAVSVSNTMDRAELDRTLVKHLNDSITDLQTKSKQHFYRLNDHILKSETNNALINQTQDIPLTELMGEVKELQPIEKEYEDLVNHLPRDCSKVTGPAKTYLIHPGHSPLETWCVNGSTLLQRRYNGSIEFNRKFVEYVNGFGNAASEYWMGLESMHQLTADNCSAMRIDMVDIYGGVWYAQYDYFSVGNADGGYVLEVSGFKGNASDAFEYQNHMEFSAIDHDRDISNTHCAGNYEGGWWFSHCQHVNINGKYSLGLTWFDSVKNEWIAVATSEMRMYRTC